MITNKERVREILGLPEEANIKGVIWRWVKSENKKYKYPAVYYELHGRKKLKHINSKTLSILKKENLLDYNSANNLTNNLTDNLTNNLTPQQLLHRLTDELETLTDKELEEIFEDIKFFLFKYLDRREWDFADLTFYALKDADKKRVMDAFRGILDGLAVQINHGKLNRSNLLEIKQSIQLFWGILKRALKK